MDMEFWGVEVKSGETLKCDPGEHNYVHLSQVALGEIKKADKQNDYVPIYVTVDNKKLVIGSLSAEKCTHTQLDLVFEKEFELSHSWKNGSVFFCGYKSTNIEEEDDDDDSGSEEDVSELLPVVKSENGKPDVKTVQPKQAIEKPKTGKPDAGLTKSKANAGPDVGEDDDDDDDDDDDEEEEEDSDDEGGDDDDEDMLGSDEDDDDEDDDESDSADEETPVKADKGKKRPNDSATKTPGPEKKAKLVTPDGGKTGVAEGKKGGHAATPYPKQAGKTPAADKGKQTPNSEAKKSGQVTCKTCSRSFGTEQSLDSHTKAKHSAASK